jgi:hypothetical protein
VRGAGTRSPGRCASPRHAGSVPAVPSAPRSGR